jgi:hypothetical protein
MAREYSAAAYLHEFIEPQVRRHNNDHADLEKRLHEMVRAYNTLGQLYNELRSAYSAQDKRLSELEARCAGLASLVASIDSRFTNIAGMWTRENHPELQTESDHRHHDSAGEYERFLQGEVFPLVITPTSEGRILPAVQQALAYSGVTYVLFGSPEPVPDDAHAVLADLGLDHEYGKLADLCRRAAAITDHAASLGRSFRWDFEQGDGEFDAVRQVRYPGSADEGAGEVVAFIVSPGYVVGDGKVVVRQQVFTECPAAPDH